MVGIIDYGVGNLRSVQKAFEAVGVAARILLEPEAMMVGIDRVVLPGVGAFGDGMQLLRQREWIEPIQEWVAQRRPLLGVCLGMQLLFEGSQEDAPSPQEPVSGLGILPGTVVRFREDDVPPGHDRLKVPHMGWNTLQWTREDPLLRGIRQNEAVYFVHSYHVQPTETQDAPLTCATADYGRPFCATIWRGNIWATQFHPEKSQRVGLTMLRNFATV